MHIVYLLAFFIPIAAFVGLIAYGAFVICRDDWEFAWPLILMFALAAMFVWGGYHLDMESKHPKQPVTAEAQ